MLVDPVETISLKLTKHAQNKKPALVVRQRGLFGF
jgi:hypothetical protein